MRKILALFTMILLAVGISCSSRNQPVVHTEPIVLTQTKEVREVVRDTVFKIAKDSAFYRAFIECRDGKAYLVKPKAEGGKNIKPPQVTLDREGNLSITVETEAQKLFAKWKEKHIRETVPKVVYKDRLVYKEKTFGWYYTTLVYGGYIFYSLIGIVVVTGILRWKKII